MNWLKATRSLLRQTLAPAVLCALWLEGAWLALTIIIDALRNGLRHETFFYVLVSAVILGFFVFDLRAVGWTALWRGVVAGKARQAEQDATGQVLLLPWLAAFLAWLILMPATGPSGGVIATILVWMASSIAANRWFTRRARHNLETQLNLWALRRSAGEFEHYDGWRQLGRRLGRWWRLQFQRL